jgi:hypothetical protein
MTVPRRPCASGPAARTPCPPDTIMPKTLATATVDQLLYHAHLILMKGTQTVFG